VKENNKRHSLQQDTYISEEKQTERAQAKYTETSDILLEDSVSNTYGDDHSIHITSSVNPTDL
jgi:hypothetical protein